MGLTTIKIIKFPVLKEIPLTKIVRSCQGKNLIILSSNALSEL